MNDFHKNITFIIVTYRSENIIEKCLKKIPKKCRVIIVENSYDFLLKIYLSVYEFLQNGFFQKKDYSLLNDSV